MASRKVKIEVKQSYNTTLGFIPNKFYFHVKARNGRILFSSEIFANRSNAVRAAKALYNMLFPIASLVLPE